VGNEEGVSPLPSGLGVWESVVNSPSGVRGGAPAATAFFGIFEVHKTLVAERTVLLY